MKERLAQIREKALAQINASESLDNLNDIRVAFLGKKGELTEVLKGMKDVAPEDRPAVGQIVNETRQAIEEVLDKAKKNLAAKKERVSDESGSYRCYTSSKESKCRTQSSKYTCT